MFWTIGDSLKVIKLLIAQSSPQQWFQCPKQVGFGLGIIFGKEAAVLAVLFI